MDNIELVVRLANPPIELVAKYTRKERQFFFDYSTYILRLFNSPQVEQQLHALIATERIQAMKSIDLRIMGFPARPLHGRPRNVLHGSYNHDTAQISIYPLKMNRNWIHEEGFSMFRTLPSHLPMDQKRILHEIYSSAVGTFIHEILHVKFEERGLSRYSEEAIVRKLEKQYAEQWLTRLPPDLALNLLPTFSEL